MKLKIIIIFILLKSSFFGETLNNGDTLILNPINWDTPSPEGWNAQYKVDIDFPNHKGPWSKIIMVQTLKCDSATKGDKYPCGEWDYIWNTLLTLSTEDSMEIFSLGSFVTPYGKRLVLGGKKGWEWSYDLTDYAPLLQGKRRLLVGNNQELLDLQFLFIKGSPPRDIIKVENIYPFGEYKYHKLSDNLSLKEKSIFLLPEASSYKIKSVISGHGHEGPRNCCEWDSKTHTYYMNGWEIFRWNVWKDCGNNPIYPQGGTWPFDRAGWCPGTKVDEYNFELTPYVHPGDSILIDYGIEPYSNNGEKNGFFYMTHQLFSYGPINFNYDAELIDVISPTDKQKHSRENPIFSGAKIVIRNNGKFDLQSLKIIYGLKNRKKSIYKWIGNLRFLETEVIQLPPPHWNGLKNSKEFIVKIKSPNGMKDDNLINNQILTKIPEPIILPNEFIIKLNTNNIGRARENSFTLTEKNGFVLYSGNNFFDSTVYNYPIKVKNGYYEFSFQDVMEDGISLHWWNRNQPEKIGINGSILFLSISGDTLHQFKPDFGDALQLNFFVGSLP